LTRCCSNKELGEVKIGQKKLKAEIGEIKGKLGLLENGIGEILELIKARDK